MKGVEGGLRAAVEEKIEINSKKIAEKFAGNEKVPTFAPANEEYRERTKVFQKFLE